MSGAPYLSLRVWGSLMTAHLYSLVASVIKKPEALIHANTNHKSLIKSYRVSHLLCVLTTVFVCLIVAYQVTQLDGYPENSGTVQLGPSSSITQDD